MNKGSYLCCVVVTLCSVGFAFACTRARPETVVPAASSPTNTLPYCTPVATGEPTSTLPVAGPTVISAEASPSATQPEPTPTAAPTSAGPTATFEPTAEPTSAAPEISEYIVQPFDTLFSIACRFGTTVDTLAALNGLSNVDLIHAGQVLKVRGTPTTSGEGQYVVRHGDTMFSIARRFGVSVEALGQANGIGSPWVIHPGQVLAIPSGATAPATSSTGSTQGNTYTVQAGDTLFSIAARFGSSVDAIASANGISDPQQLAAGQVLVIP